LRLDDLRHELDIERLAEALGYRWTNTLRRPRLRSNGVIYSRSMRAAEVAAFLIDLERLGFAFDPQPLIDALRPGVMKSTTITDAELEIFWAPRTRHKAEITLKVEDGNYSFGEYREGKFTNGYRFIALFRKDGSIHSLNVRGSRHRRVKSPVKTVCNECGDTWWRGDPDSSAGHRKEHKQRMHILAPAPHALMIEALRVESDPELVNSVSPAWKHFEIYRRAQAFKREERYDFTQWQSSEGDDDPHVHGFLFANSEGAITGAASFRWRVPAEPSPPHWGLQWVWVCPRHRRQGVLSSRWHMLRERFGAFVVEGPVSEGMHAFLVKRGESDLMRWPESRAADFS